MIQVNNAADLRLLFKDVHNFIYANDSIKQHASVFEEIMKVLVAKLFDERHGDRKGFFIEDYELRELSASNACPSFEQRFHNLLATSFGHPEMKGIFDDGDETRLSSYVLGNVVKMLQGVTVRDSDMKGVAFQAIVGPLLRLEQGQFFTPEPAKRLMVEIIDPLPTELVLDPACGSGGLLIAAMNHCRQLGPTVVGIDSERAMTRIAKLYMVLMGSRAGGVITADALQDIKTLRTGYGSVLGRDTADIILTNPPFGSRAVIARPEVLRQFPNLGATRNRQVPEILFIERILQLLRDGGRTAIVLPIGIMANQSLSYVRDYVRRSARIAAVVSLPEETFQVADVGVRACIVFLKKDSSQRVDGYPTFRAVSGGVGYDRRGRTTYRNGMSGIGVRVDEDITQIIEAWKDFRAEYGQTYFW